MKKNPRLLLAACLIAAFSCARNPQPGPAAEKTYLDDVLTDYAALAAAYPEAKDRFVEAPPQEFSRPHDGPGNNAGQVLERDEAMATEI